MNDIYFYYLRNEGNHPYGCVAISKNSDNTINRGVSLCSKKDHFDRNHARGLALSRLNEAIFSKSSEKFACYYGCKSNSYKPQEALFDCKYEYDVVPTKEEYRIMNKPE